MIPGRLCPFIFREPLWKPCCRGFLNLTDSRSRTRVSFPHSNATCTWTDHSLEPYQSGHAILRYSQVQEFVGLIRIRLKNLGGCESTRSTSYPLACSRKALALYTYTSTCLCVFDEYHRELCAKNYPAFLGTLRSGARLLVVGPNKNLPRLHRALLDLVHNEDSSNIL